MLVVVDGVGLIILYLSVVSVMHSYGPYVGGGKHNPKDNTEQERKPPASYGT